MTADTLFTLPPEMAKEWPYQPRYTSVNGWRMHYIDEGPRDAPPILLLHGNPTWGFLWRKTIPVLVAAGYRVIVPDQIGFGLSEKPTNEHDHALDGHAANLVALVRHLDLQNLTVVCHDWGGPTGLSMALHEASRVRALVIMSTWAWADPPGEFHTRVFPWRTMHAPLVGPYLLGKHNALAGRGTYLSVVGREQFRDEAQEVYEGALPDAATRMLTWVWPRWIPIDDTARAKERFDWMERELSQSKLPAMIIWGREDEVFDAASFLPRWQKILPHAEGPHMVTGRHFLQEDSGFEIGELVREFVGKLEKQGA